MPEKKPAVLSEDLPFDLLSPSAAISKAKKLDFGRKETGKDVSRKERERKKMREQRDFTSCISIGLESHLGSCSGGQRELKRVNSRQISEAESALHSYKTILILIKKSVAAKYQRTSIF